jgi:hypothetical protein|tara:strand:+ start:465 stop:638 length:174 start_codon:yes stop_codon:yes gene_type:complete
MSTLPNGGLFKQLLVYAMGLTTSGYDVHFTKDNNTVPVGAIVVNSSLYGSPRRMVEV